MSNFSGLNIVSGLQ